MTNEEIKQSVAAQFPGATFDETGEFLQVLTEGADAKQLLTTLRRDAALDMNFLFCLTCIDWKTHLTMVYHLLSKEHRHSVVVKVRLADTNNPETDTVSDIWQTANFHEREVYDLFGVRFRGHPDMRRILLSEDWDGHPLRKNYVDENMISL